MIQLILNQDVQICRQLKREIVPQVCAIISPRQRDDLNGITLRAQIFHQHAVIHVSAAEGVNGAVDEEADFHNGYVTLSGAKSPYNGARDASSPKSGSSA